MCIYVFLHIINYILVLYNKETLYLLYQILNHHKSSNINNKLYYISKAEVLLMIKSIIIHLYISYLKEI